MLTGKKKSTEAAPGRFGDLKESKARLGGAMEGRSVVVVTEGKYQANEAKLLRRTMEAVGAEGKAISYPSFFSKPQDVKADVLLLRTSKLFTYVFTDLVRSLQTFRRCNPEAAVIACVIDQPVHDLLARNPELVNVVDAGLSNDYELLRKGAQVLERMQ